MSSPRTLVTLLITLLATLPVAGPSAAAPAADPADRAPNAPAGGHRIVWDQFKRDRSGIHLRSARPDGSDVRRVADLPQGFTLALTMDPAGRRVAFATCCRDDFPQLVVARVRGGRVQQPLRRHPDLVAVGGIGWSPDGRRLAFEAIRVRGDERQDGIWTIRPDGRGLRLLLPVPAADDEHQPVINDELGWTARGILYSDGADLRVLRNGRSRLVVRDVRSVRISGDHRHLVLGRTRGPWGSIWTARADGSHLRRLLQLDEPGVGTTYVDVVPDHDASAFLAFRMRPTDNGHGRPDQGLVTWSAGQRPQKVPELAFTGDGDYVATWN